MTKLSKSHYQLQNGFEIYLDITIQGQCKWVVTHADEEVLAKYEEEQYDQLFATMYEAKMYVIDIEL